MWAVTIDWRQPTDTPEGALSPDCQPSHGPQSQQRAKRIFSKYHVLSSHTALRARLVHYLLWGSRAVNCAENVVLFSILAVVMYEKIANC